MKRIALSLAALGVLGVLAVFNAPATASDLSVLLRGLSYGSHHVARENHARHHDDLEHRDYHRELDHRSAHRSPMTHRQHGELHDGLNHEAYHDHREHRSAHRNRAYSPYRGSRLNYGSSSYRRYSHAPQGRRYQRNGWSISLGH